MSLASVNIALRPILSLHMERHCRKPDCWAFSSKALWYLRKEAGDIPEEVLGVRVAHLTLQVTVPGQPALAMPTLSRYGARAWDGFQRNSDHVDHIAIWDEEIELRGIAARVRSSSRIYRIYVGQGTPELAKLLSLHRGSVTAESYVVRACHTLTECLAGDGYRWDAAAVLRTPELVVEDIRYLVLAKKKWVILYRTKADRLLEEARNTTFLPVFMVT